jgi:hypothetical protein
MKKIALLFVLALISAAGCEPGGSHTVYTNGLANITFKSIPKTGKVGQNISITAHGEAYSDCWSDLKINLDVSEAFNYNLLATGYYESWGSCNTTIIATDTIITFKPSAAGDYVIFTYMSPYVVTKDTIVVAP